MDPDTGKLTTGIEGAIGDIPGEEAVANEEGMSIRFGVGCATDATAGTACEAGSGATTVEAAIAASTDGGEVFVTAAGVPMEPPAFLPNFARRPSRSTDRVGSGVTGFAL